MFKISIIVIIATVIAIALTGNIIPNNNVTLYFLDYEIIINSNFLLLMAIVIIAGVFLISYSYFTICNGFIKRSLNNKNNKYRIATDAIADSLVNLSLGNIKSADKSIAKVHKYLGKNHQISNLLTLREALLINNKQQINKSCNNLLNNDVTKPLALRGLAGIAKQNNDNNKAEKHLEEAYNNSPGSIKLISPLVEIYRLNGKWKKLNDLIQKNKNLIPDYEVNLAISFYELALEDENNFTKYIAKAYSLYPDHQQIIIKYAESIKHRTIKCGGFIKKVWQDFAHPELLEIYINIYKKKTIKSQLNQIAKLIKINPREVSSYISFAKIAVLEEKLIPSAIKQLEDALQIMPTKEAYDLLIKLKTEIDDDDSEITRLTLESEQINNILPLWRCVKCSDNAKSWSAICNNCTGFNSYQWENKRISKYNIKSS